MKTHVLTLAFKPVKCILTTSSFTVISRTFGVTAQGFRDAALNLGACVLSSYASDKIRTRRIQSGFLTAVSSVTVKDTWYSHSFFFFFFFWKQQLCKGPNNAHPPCFSRLSPWPSLLGTTLVSTKASSVLVTGLESLPGESICCSFWQNYTQAHYRKLIPQRWFGLFIPNWNYPL